MRRMANILDQATQDSGALWATICSGSTAIVENHPFFTRLLFHIVETGVNDIEYRVQAADDADFTNVETLDDALGDSVFDVASGASDWQTLCDCWRYVRVQIRDDVPGTHGNVTCVISAGQV